MRVWATDSNRVEYHDNAVEFWVGTYGLAKDEVWQNINGVELLEKRK
jgi:hypothetical protein